MLRSRVSNRPGRLPGVDGRCERARRFKDLTSEFRRDISRAPSAADASLIDQAAALVIPREMITASSARGQLIDTKELVKIAGALGRTLAALGLTQRPGRISRSAVLTSESRSTAPPSRSEIVSRVVLFLERARYSQNSELLARAAQVRALLETAQRRKDARADKKPDTRTS
jgi:hypothetical protein